MRKEKESSKIILGIDYVLMKKLELLFTCPTNTLWNEKLQLKHES